MIGNFSKYILLSFFIAFPIQNFAQEITVTKRDGQVIANIKGVSVPTPITQYDKAVDPFQIMSSFDVRVSWRLLMGEVVEKYDFTWYRTGKMVLGDNTITRDMLKKYPDLLKRFDNIEPYQVWVFLEGDVTGKNISVKRGGVPKSDFKTRRLNSFKKNGQSYDRYATSGDFIYMIDQVKILPNKSGRKGDGIIGGSPHWNEFLYWDDGDPSFDRGIYKKGKKSDKTLLNANKKRFSDMQKVTLRAELDQVEWYDSELQSIVDRYYKYEKGELKPDDVGDNLNDLLSGGDANDNCANDLNAMLSGCGQTVTDYEIKYRDGKRGVVTKDGRVLIPFKEWNITNYDPNTGLAEVRKSLDKFGDYKRCGPKNNVTSVSSTLNVYVYELATVDASGSYVLPPKKYADILEETPLNLYLESSGLIELKRENPAEYKRLKERRARERAANRSVCDSWEKSRLSEYKRRLGSQGIEIAQNAIEQ